MPDKVYGTRRGFKVTCWILAVVCTVLVVLFPFAVLMVWIAHKASVRITDDKLIIRWIGTREVPWSDISGFGWVRAAGLVAGMLRPITYQLRSNPKAAPRLALGAYEGSDEILAELTRRTGLAIAAAS